MVKPLAPGETIIAPLQQLECPILFKRMFVGQKGWVIPSVTSMWERRLTGPQVLFQDGLGEVPVTALEQRIGLMRDVSGNDLHFVQMQELDRPVISARFNRAPHSFSLAGWLPQTLGSGVAPAPAESLEGGPFGHPAWEMTFNSHGTTPADASGVFMPALVGVEPDVLYRVKVWLKAIDENDVGKDLTLTVNGYRELITAPDDWIGFEVNDVANDAEEITFGIGTYGDSGGAPVTVLFGGIDLRPSSFVANLPDYQEVVSSTNYDDVGFPVYLRSDGATSFMATQQLRLTETSAFATGFAISTAKSKAASPRWLVTANGPDGEVWGIEAPASSGLLVVNSPLGGTNHQVTEILAPSEDRVFLFSEEGEVPIPLPSKLSGSSVFRLFGSSRDATPAFDGMFFGGFWIDRWLTPFEELGVTEHFKTTMNF